MKQAFGLWLPCLLLAGCAAGPPTTVALPKPPPVLIGTPVSEGSTTSSMQALEAGSVTGQALLRFTVKTDGSVTAPQMMFSTLPPTAEAGVLAATRQWRFKPALEGQRPVERDFIYPLFFGVDAAQQRTQFFCRHQAEVYAADSACEIVTVGHWRIYRMDPVYPPRLLSKRLAGAVTLGFDIGPQGQVVNATVVGATPAELFDAAALAAVRQWYFAPLDNPPARSMDHVSVQHVTVTVRFTPPVPEVVDKTGTTPQ